MLLASTRHWVPFLTAPEPVQASVQEGSAAHTATSASSRGLSSSGAQGEWGVGEGAGRTSQGPQSHLSNPKKLGSMYSSLYEGQDYYMGF